VFASWWSRFDVSCVMVVVLSRHVCFVTWRLGGVVVVVSFHMAVVFGRIMVVVKRSGGGGGERGGRCVVM
jgi:hypothetical protein